MSDNAVLIRKEEDGSISFGDYTLEVKSKASDFEFNGDLYKVKTFYEITKLERNDKFMYESVPGTTVTNFLATEKVIRFHVEGIEDAQITLELEEETEYEIYVDDMNVGRMKTNLSGKLIISVELSAGRKVSVKAVKC